MAADDQPSIAELQQLSSGWPTDLRPGIGEEGEWQGFWWCHDKDGLDDRVSADVDEDYENDFARLVAGLQNAAPVLLEIAAAALAFHASDQRLAEAKLAMHVAPSAREYRRAGAALTGIAAERDEKYAAMADALAKVRP